MPIDIRSVRLSIEALQKGTKTSIGLTAPPPLVHFAFDMGFERALFGLMANYWRGLDIKVYDYEPKVNRPSKALWQGHDLTIFKLPSPIQTDPIAVRGTLELWNYFNELIAYAAMDTEYLNSAVVDTMTRARRTRGDAHLETLQYRNAANKQPLRESLIQIEWGKVNESIRDIYTNFEARGVNLIALHHLQDERKDMPVTDGKGSVTIQSVMTGGHILEGYNKTYQTVDMAIRTKLIENKDKSLTNEAVFQECGYNPNLKGTSIRDVTWNSLMSWVEMSLGGTIAFPKSQIAPLGE